MAVEVAVLEEKQSNALIGGPVTRIAVTRVTPTRLGTALTFDCCCGEQQVALGTVPMLGEPVHVTVGEH